MGLETKIAGINLCSYTLGASGVRDTTFSELDSLGSSASSAIIMKSSTINPRWGNPEPRLAKTDLGIIQSMGWPNLGYKTYLDFISLLKKKYDKPIIASVAGFNINEYMMITSAFQNSDVDLIEISLSCPNIEGHPQIGYDFIETEKLIDKIMGLGPKPIGLKLPFYPEFYMQEKISEIIVKYNIPFISLINSIGNSLIINPETERPLIKPREGIGGLCGKYIKHMALGNVRGFYKLLGEKISIFGVGGIESGEDAFEFLLAGADAVQIGTTFEKEGLRCFERINKELEKILNRKEYNSIREAKGALKFL